MSKETPTIGIDFGGTSVKIAVAHGDKLAPDMARIPTQDYEEPETLMDAIGDAINILTDKYPDVAAIGVGVPGAIDFERGLIYNLTNVRGWTNVPMRDMVKDRFGLPAILENDANCMAYAEFRHGAGKGFEHVVCVTLGTGVGGGLILNGELFRGSRYAAGEIGQMSVNLFGVDGPYGNSGALERYVGNRQIEEMAKQKFFDSDQDAPTDISPKSLSQLAESGDGVAIAIWDNVATHVASCLMSICYLLNPDAIVIGGGVANAGKVLFNPLRDKLANSLTPECFDNLSILPARFGNDAGIIGCSTIARESIV